MFILQNYKVFYGGKRVNKNEKIAVALGVAGLVILNVYSNSKLKNEIRSLQNEVVNINGNMSNNLGGLSYNLEEFKTDIRAQLEKQGSILSSHDFDIAYNEGKMKIKLSAVPKEFNGEETVKFIVEDEEFPAVNEGGAFVATCSITPSDTVKARVQFIKGDVIRQEELPIFNLGEELAIYPNVLMGDSFYDLKDSAEKYKNILVLSCYNGNKKIGLMNPREITLIIRDSDTKKAVKEVPMENPPSEIINSESFKFDDGETFVYSADLSEIMELEGKYVVDCNLVTENGLVYNFQVGEFTSNKQDKYSQWGTMSGVVYPNFD